MGTSAQICVAWELGLATLAWELWYGSITLETLTWELQLKENCLGYVAQPLSIVFRSASFVRDLSPAWAWEAGGTSRGTPAEPG